MNAKKVFTNVIWRFMEKIGASGVSFIVSIILARLLEPDDYGTVALVTVIITILNVFISSGLGTALVQKKDADDIDFSSVFYFNVVVCILLYIIMFTVAPCIALYYRITKLTNIIRVISLLLVISGLKNIQHAYVAKNLLFKRFFFATLIGTVVAAVIGIYLAYHGYGPWAIVAQELLNASIDTIILWITVKWRPKLKFSLIRLKSLLSFGWKILVTDLIETVYARLIQLIIGKRYSSADLAYYNKGDTFPSHVVTSVNLSIDSVLLPVMSRKQDENITVRSIAKKAIKMSTYIMLPLMIGLFVCAKSLVSLLLTEKWVPCIPYMRIMCLIYSFKTIHTTNSNAIKSLGRSDIVMKQQIIKKTCGIFVILITMFFGTLTMAYGLLLIELIAQIVDAWPNKNLIGYGFLEQQKDIMPNFFASIIMGVIVSLISMCVVVGDFLSLIIQVITGIVSYLLISIILKIECFEYLINILVNLRAKKTNSL